MSDANEKMAKIPGNSLYLNKWPQVENGNGIPVIFHFLG